MPFAIVYWLYARLNTYLWESPKDSHHFIFGFCIWHIRTHAHASNTQYAFCYTFYCLCDYLARSSVGVFRLLFNVVSVALPSILLEMWTLLLLSTHLLSPPFSDARSFSRCESHRRWKSGTNFFLLNSFCARRVCTSYDLYEAIYFRLNPFRFGSDDWDEIWWWRGWRWQWHDTIRKMKNEFNFRKIEFPFEIASKHHTVIHFFLNQISCFERKSFFSFLSSDFRLILTHEEYGK